MAKNEKSKSAAKSSEGKSSAENNALKMALSKIEKDFGEGAIMKMNEGAHKKVEVISTGSLGLDLALGVGGVPRGRVVECRGSRRIQSPPGNCRWALAMSSMSHR